MLASDVYESMCVCFSPVTECSGRALMLRYLTARRQQVEECVWGVWGPRQRRWLCGCSRCDKCLWWRHERLQWSSQLFALLVYPTPGWTRGAAQPNGMEALKKIIPQLAELRGCYFKCCWKLSTLKSNNDLFLYFQSFCKWTINSLGVGDENNLKVSFVTFLSFYWIISCFILYY